MKEVEKLQPRAFTKFCMSIGAVPSSYIAGLTIEEQLLWFCSYLEKEVIPVVNNNSEVVEELKYFVEHYFDNLDVQEEINNKLDEMAESGELAEIIAQYVTLQSVLAYNTVAEMQAATNIVEGSLVKTYGFHSNGDGGEAYYKVRDILNTDTIDNMTLFALDDPDLVAEFVRTTKNIDPKKLGAYGDGTHDDILPINKALELGNVLLSDGTYLISDSINIISNKIFDGNNSFIIPAENKPAFKGVGTTSAPIVETYIKNIQITTTNSGGYGIYLENGYFNYFDNINIIKLKGNDAYGFKFVNGFNQVVTNSRVYGDYENYTGQIGLDISTTSGYMSNMTNLKYDTILIQCVDYGVKANYSVSSNTVEFNNMGFSACKYAFYLQGTALPITINNTRIEGISRAASETLYGFYLQGGIRPTINTFNAYDITNVIYTTITMLTLLGNICLYGNNQSPLFNFVDQTSTGKIFNFATMYISGLTYQAATPTTVSYSNSKTIEDGTNTTSTVNAFQAYDRIVKQTSNFIAYVNGKKGSVVYVWTDADNLLIRGKTNKPDTTNQFDADVPMVKGKMYKFYMIDDNKSILLG